jgi:T-complex protein 1 subunit theta
VHLSLVIVATNLVIKAVLAVFFKNLKNFNVDNICVVKIISSSLQQSKVVKGIVFARELKGITKKV